MRASRMLVLLVLATLVLAERVVMVYDGDTFLTADSARVRLLGVDTPELYQPGGDIARDILEKLVLGKQVRLEQDKVDRDEYGRLLRYVWVGDTMVNLELVACGYAVPRKFQDTLRYWDSLLALERSAARAGRGLWAFNVFQPPTLELLQARIAAESVSAETTARGLPVISWADAGNYVGRLVAVEGVVVATYNSGRVCFLNFHQDYRRYFRVAIFSQDFAKFPPQPENYYLRRRIRVTGIIKEYKGAPEMIVNDPGQIELLDR
ncbi:MAG: thermonuclease family protein [candidate division WOR-3 bacterium]